MVDDAVRASEKYLQNKVADVKKLGIARVSFAARKFTRR
jgi:hypothetical protein